MQIKHVLPKLCHLPQYSYGSRYLTTRVRGKGWEFGIRTHTEASDRVGQPILNLYSHPCNQRHTGVDV